MRIFQVGFNKCGTTSLHKHFVRRGFAAISHDDGRLACRIKANFLSDRSIIEGYETYSAFTDIVYLSHREHVEGFKYYRQIFHEIPDALFVLNTRDKAKWLKSCRNHPAFVERMQSVYGYERPDDVIEHWSRDWDEHHQNVRAFVPAEQLLEFQIDCDEVTKLDAFLGCDTPKGDSLPTANTTRSRRYKPIKRLGKAIVKNSRISS